MTSWILREGEDQAALAAACCLLSNPDGALATRIGVKDVLCGIWIKVLQPERKPS